MYIFIQFHISTTGETSSMVAEHRDDSSESDEEQYDLSEQEELKSSSDIYETDMETETDTSGTDQEPNLPSQRYNSLLYNCI
jgi:cobalamin biosynthesis protein CobT